MLFGEFMIPLRFTDIVLFIILVFFTTVSLYVKTYHQSQHVQDACKHAYYLVQTHIMHIFKHFAKQS